jgi:hypothetical protein
LAPSAENERSKVAQKRSQTFEMIGVRELVWRFTPWPARSLLHARARRGETVHDWETSATLKSASASEVD